MNKNLIEVLSNQTYAERMAFADDLAGNVADYCKQNMDKLYEGESPFDIFDRNIMAIFIQFYIEDHND